MIKNYTLLTKDSIVKCFISKSIVSFKTITTLLFILFGIQMSFAQTTVTITATGAGTFTVPCDVTSVTVQAWGGGGAGGGESANNSKGGGGGAGGTYVSSVLPVTAGTTYNLFVGAGAGGANSAGANGQESWFNTTGTLFAQGGAGGAAPNNGTVAGGVGSIATSIGTTRIAGTTGANGTTTTGGAGGNGGNAGGAGGAQRTTENNGSNGAAPGGAGGGAFIDDNTNHSGGNGARGEIRITYTSALLTYCAQNFTTVEQITNVTYAGINNTTANTGTPALESFCFTANVLRGGTNAISLKGNTAGAFTNYFRVYIDWDQNGVFGNVANEIYDIGTINNSTGIDAAILTGNITVPIAAALGNTRMRVVKNYNAYTGPCTSATYGQAEDYTVNVAAPAPCVAPTTQPTALLLTPTGNTISGSFTAAVPAPNNYLVVMNLTGIAPTSPVNGTSYAIGGTLGAGNTIIDNDTDTAFTATGLTPSTTYYFFIYSFNSLCTGGPLYRAITPLTGNTTTLAANYCTPSISNAYYPPTNYIRRVSFVGTLQDIDNPSSYDMTAPYGYEDFTGLALKGTQAQGQGVNIYMETTFSGYYKAWVDWNKDGDFADAGEAVYDVGGIAQSSTTFGFIIPPATPPGNYRVRLRMSGRNAGFGGDAGFGWNSCTTNVAYSGETEDYLFTVIASCNAIITSVTEGTTCGTGTVNLGAFGTGSPTQYRWYTSEFGGAPVATTATGAWTTPSISTTTNYWVTAFNGCESHSRTKVTANVSPVAVISFTPSIPEICGENNVLSLTAAGDVQQTYLINEKFTAGLGVMTNQNIVTNGGATDALTNWQNRTSTFVPAQQTWYPAVASGLNGNQFALTTSDVGAVTTHNAILSPIVNTNTYLDLTLSFDIFHSRYYVDGTNLGLEYVTIDVSTNGGGAWTEIERITTDLGYGTRFVNKNYNLNAYINQPNFRVRVRYYAEWCDGIAIDNFKLYGNVPLNTAFDWTAGAAVDAYQDAACTIPYVSGTPIVTVYIKPTLAQLETPTFSFTATATLSNGCSVSQNVSITNKTSVWKGTTNNDWNNPNNWLPVGVPTINTCVIIPDVTATNPSRILGANYNAFGKTLQVKNLGNLQIQPTNTLTIQDYVDVTAGGTFDIENSGSLIQVNNVANTGIISMKRNANIRKLDYVYWSSPVANFASNAISPGTPVSYIYKWTPTIGANTNGWGNWASGSESMVRGKGYIVRGPDSFTATAANFTANFTGIPNNGTINMPISRGTYNGVNYSTGVSSTLATRDDDNWNLIGNPYPSAVNANIFLATNTNIAGYVKYWTHGLLPSAVIIDPFYNDYVLNYTVGDYVTYNATGANPPLGNGNIGAGQGFFVLMNHTSAATTENVVFNNTMRRNDYRNDLFFRNTNAPTFGEEEKHRIWLNLISPTSNSTTTLIGYIEGATNSLDRMYDAQALDIKTDFELYSFSNTDKVSIQGRSLPFNQSDEVNLGISTPQNGIYTIAISSLDGLFSDTNQDIYLEDKQLGIFHDLRTAPYTFTGTVGRNENRFVLLYNSSRLSQEDNSLTNNILVATNENVTVHSSIENINSIEVHDLLGRTIKTYNNIDSTEFLLGNLPKNNTTLFLRIKLNNGDIVDKKVIF